MKFKRLLEINKRINFLGYKKLGGETLTREEQAELDQLLLERSGLDKPRKEKT